MNVLTVSVPLWFGVLGVAAGFAIGAFITYGLFAREPRRIVADLRDAKDAGELSDVKDETLS